MKHRLISSMFVTVVAAELVLGPVPAWAADEDLMFAEIPVVYSAARREQPLSQVTTAITVITQDDIQRSGVTSIPEALRLAPGISVSRIDAHTWAISSRGFSDNFGNKLLVLIDGRSVYSPLFAGVYWDAQNVLLEDIERIEVIRGPGATLWGANAVNGVINIITKHAHDTPGGLVTARGGTQEQGGLGARYGGQLNAHTSYRVSGQVFNQGDSPLRGGGDAADHWHMGQGGFSIDSQPSEENFLMVQGNVYAGDEGYKSVAPNFPAPYAITNTSAQHVMGGHLLGRWTHTFAPDTEFQLQMYYDGTARDSGSLMEDRHTFDVDWQHRFPLGTRQNVTWGLGYRLSADRTEGTYGNSFAPADFTLHLLSGFLQDELTLIEKRLRLTLGSKLEHNDFTGFEVQPSARLLWTPHERHTFWAAVSRAVHTPARSDHDENINFAVTPGFFPTVVRIRPSPELDSESMIAYELGYRVTPSPKVSFDVSAFYNVYDRLRTLRFGAPFFEATPAPAHFVVPIDFVNEMHGETYGVEFSADWKPYPWWRLRADYTFLDIQLHKDANNTDGTTPEIMETADPQHQLGLRSSMDLPQHLFWDVWLRYVDQYASRSTLIKLPSYVTLDVRLAWRPNANLEIAVVGQNLLEPRRLEFTPLFNTQTTDVPRGVYGKVTWKF